MRQIRIKTRGLAWSSLTRKKEISKETKSQLKYSLPQWMQSKNLLFHRISQNTTGSTETMVQKQIFKTHTIPTEQAPGCSEGLDLCQHPPRGSFSLYVVYRSIFVTSVKLLLNILLFCPTRRKRKKRKMKCKQLWFYMPAFFPCQYAILR